MRQPQQLDLHHSRRAPEVFNSPDAPDPIPPIPGRATAPAAGAAAPPRLGKGDRSRARHAPRRRQARRLRGATHRCGGDRPRSALDLLLLASRLEDADTLFFHRRLELTGDVELGLAVRNLLDQLPWDSLPLGLRIALNRGARLARSARDAYRSAEA